MVRKYIPKPATKRRCFVCGRVFTAKRVDARFCGKSCRARASRYGAGSATAHQYAIRPAAQDFTPWVLDGCAWREVTRAEAVPTLEQFEWLGDAGHADRFFAAYDQRGRTMAVCGFVTKFHRHSDDPGCVLLGRGCTTPEAHRHAATWLLGRALRVLKREGFTRVIAYSDPLAGERGVIYSALGLRPVGEPRGRWRVRPPGVKWQDHGACHSDRWLRHGGRRWTVAQARSRGYRVERVPSRVLWRKDL